MSPPRYVFSKLVNKPLKNDMDIFLRDRGQFLVFGAFRRHQAIGINRVTAVHYFSSPVKNPKIFLHYNNLASLFH